METESDSLKSNWGGTLPVITSSIFKYLTNQSLKRILFSCYLTTSQDRNVYRDTGRDGRQMQMGGTHKPGETDRQTGLVKKE